MESDAALGRLLSRVAGVAALALGFADGGVSLVHRAASVQRRSGRPTHESLRRLSEELDRQVVDRGLPRVVEDLTELGTSGVETATAGPLAGTDGASTGVRGAYLGIPLRADGAVVGVLSLRDPAPRPIGRREVRTLVEFGRLVIDQLDARDPGRDPDLDPDPVPDQPDAAVAEIRAGLDAGEMVPWYQPVVALDSQRVIGVEALVRWRRANGVIEQPATFLPLAERSDLIIDIDREILRRALDDLAGWQHTNPDFRVSVNLSGRHLDRVETLAELDRLARRAGVSPATVDLELTETARPHDLEVGGAAIARLRDRGYSVWFDDFGSGWSALQDLIRFPVDGIKLDRTFAEQLGSPVADAVVGALSAAAAQVGLKITIEGIEEQVQAARALELGCQFAQGYLWSRPLPADQVPALVGLSTPLS
jgi:EAL domain-containing protein (putative c-di-GMP-specific phosphodiesterase class I)